MRTSWSGRSETPMSRLMSRGVKRDREEIGMKVEPPGALVRQAWRLASLSLAIVFLVAVAAACGGDEEEEPTGTGTAAATGSPSTTVVGTATPQGTTAASEAAPGISDTEILLGAECILSGSMGAVYSTIPKTVSAYFNYINETEGGVCGRKIVYKVEDNTDDPARGCGGGAQAGGAGQGLRHGGLTGRRAPSRHHGVPEREGGARHPGVRRRPSLRRPTPKDTPGPSR